jgi:hypothetical protein
LASSSVAVFWSAAFLRSDTVGVTPARENDTTTQS